MRCIGSGNFLAISSISGSILFRQKTTNQKGRKTMGISKITALEIFTNPGDLEICIEQEKEGAKFSIGIFRGPGHNFKPMLTSQPFAEKLEDAVGAVKGTLESIHEILTKDLADRKSFSSLYLNPSGLEIDQSKILNQDLIARILDELRQHRVASTYKMLAPTV
jgi:hypothetical protein